MRELDRRYRPRSGPTLAVWLSNENRMGTRCVSRSVRRTIVLLTLAFVLLVPAGCGGDDSGGGGGGGGTNTTQTDDSGYGY